MTIAIIIRYHSTSSAVVHISPSYSSGYVPVAATEELREEEDEDTDLLTAAVTAINC